MIHPNLLPPRAPALGLLCLAVACAATAARAVEVPGLGWEGQGADVVITNVDTDPRPDMILMAYDNPAQANNFRYKVGFNLDASGVTANWAGFPQIEGVGWEGQGAGAAVANLDNDARPELIFMAYDNPGGANNFRYKIGWNLDNSGAAARWDAGFTMVPGVGWEGAGADVLITNLDDDARPDMLLMAYDNPQQANNFRYKIGWNLGTNGVAQRWDPGFVMVDGVGWEGQGAGAAVANLDGDPRPELLLMAYDNPARDNSFRWRIGWNLGTNGVASFWEPGFRTVAGVGWEGAGAGLGIGNVNRDPRPDLFFMAYDNPARDNSFRYWMVPDVGAAQPLWLEMDKLTSVGWPPASAVRNGRAQTLADIYLPLGVALDLRQNQGEVPDALPDACFGDADLDAFITANMNAAPPPGGAWHMYAAILTCSSDDLLGIMFDSAQRRGFAVFADAFGATEQQERLLRTTAHELGHALCLYHSDADAWRAAGPVAGAGRTVMNQTGTLAGDWGYAWSGVELGKIVDRSKRRWGPRSGYAFGDCH